MIDKMVPIRFTFMTWPALLLLVFLPNVWWGIVIKVVSILWLLGVLRGAWQGFAEVENFGPWATLNALWFGLALISPRWLVYAFSLLIVIGFMTIFRTIERAGDGSDR